MRVLSFQSLAWLVSPREGTDELEYLHETFRAAALRVEHTPGPEFEAKVSVLASEFCDATEHWLSYPDLPLEVEIYIGAHWF